MSHSVGAHGLVPLVPGLPALSAFLFDVGDLAIRPDLTISSGNTPTGHGREPQESDKAHLYNLSGVSLQSPYLL